MTASILDKNLAIIQHRWPRIVQQLLDSATATIHVSSKRNTLVVNNTQLTSNYDHLSETTRIAGGFLLIADILQYELPIISDSISDQPFH